MFHRDTCDESLTFHPTLQKRRLQRPGISPFPSYGLQREQPAQARALNANDGPVRVALPIDGDSPALVLPRYPGGHDDDRAVGVHGDPDDDDVHDVEGFRLVEAKAISYWRPDRTGVYK